jgi:putative two-component system response regulator
MEQQRILGKRILIADDEPAVRDAIRLLLRVDQHQVSEATNGREALNLFARQPFDLVITDMEMPLMKGNELAASIKRLVPKQPILMITAYAEKLGGAANNPVDALLNKPFTFADLRATIARLLTPA